MTTLPDVRRKIVAHELVIGSHVSLLDPSVRELIACVGFDSRGSTPSIPPSTGARCQHLVATHAGGAAAFVRIPWNDPVLARHVLEMGPAGIVFPMICTAEQAKAAVAACLCPPTGVRGFGPRRAVRYGVVPVEGIDAIVVGPYDLSGSAGLLGQTGITVGVSSGDDPDTVRRR